MVTTAPRLALPLFGKTLLLSLLFHLSAITLFSVVIYFPKDTLRYAKVAFREVAPREVVATAALENPLVGRILNSRPVVSSDDAALPLGDDAAARLHVGRSYFEAAPLPAEDSWMRFGKGIQQVRTILGAGNPTRLRLEAPEETTVAPQTLLVGNDLRAELDWKGSAPRELLFQTTALFVSPRPATAIEFLLTVDASGAVASVISTSAEPSDFEKEFAEYLRRCRFAPSSDGRRHDATVRVNAASETAP